MLTYKDVVAFYQGGDKEYAEALQALKARERDRVIAAATKAVTRRNKPQPDGATTH